MTVSPPFNLQAWIDRNRPLLRPPVGNKLLYQDSELIVMAVGGPNSRKDYHHDPAYDGAVPDYLALMFGNELDAVSDFERKLISLQFFTGNSVHLQTSKGGNSHVSILEAMARCWFQPKWLGAGGCHLAILGKALSCRSLLCAPDLRHSSS